MATSSALVDTPAAPSSRLQRRAGGPDVALALVAALVAAAVVVGRRLGDAVLAGTPPLFAEWAPHVGLGTPLALLVGTGVAGYGPVLAERLRWPALLLGSWAAALAWTVALALVDAPRRGLGAPLTEPTEYLSEVPAVTSVAGLVDGFAARILMDAPDAWTTHVAGHPPGALLAFVTLDRLGLGGAGWAAAMCLLAGTSAVAAVLLTLQSVAGERLARRAAPFLVVAPAAVWVGVSADAVFLGVTAWGVAVLAVAARSGRLAGAFVAGLLLGLGVYLSYGLVLMAPLALAVLVLSGSVRPLLPAVAGALTVVAAFTAGGFWWLDGYDLVVQRYYQGLGGQRPYSFWVWANLAALMICVGPATAAGLGLLRRRSVDERRLVGLASAAALAVIVATLSGLSMAEVERIWLPFAVWLLPLAALLPVRDARGWLVLQVGAALVVNSLLLTPW